MNVLLIIDIQNGLTKRKLYKEELFIDTVNNAIESFRLQENPIIFFKHINKYLKVGSEDWNIDSRIKQSDKDLYFDKTKGNAFSNNKLISFLNKNEVTDITVCGLVSHGCVLHTCKGGINLGYNINLIKNGHTNWNKDAVLKISATESDLKSIGVNVAQLK